MSLEPTRAMVTERAVVYVLQRLATDPRLAYLMGPGSQVFELLMQAGAAIASQDVDPYRETFLGPLTMQPVPAIGKAGVAIDSELMARIAAYDDQAHDLDRQSDLEMLVNHFVRRGLDVAEAERDTQTREMF